MQVIIGITIYFFLNKNLYSYIKFCSSKADVKLNITKSPSKRPAHTLSSRLQPLSRFSSGNIPAKGQNMPTSRMRSAAVAVKDRECPLCAVCDSRGHLSGKLEVHFTLEACPIYHNTSPQACM